MKHRLVFAQPNKDTFITVKNGTKRIETRAATPLYRKIQAGDKIHFICGDERFTREVATVELFDSIKSLTKKYKPSEINPKCETLEELTKMYMSFPQYPEKIPQYGLIAITLKK